MTKHTRRVLELGAGLALALTVVLTAYADWHQRTAARVRADTVRLHILANSDTWDDQLLKLQVRDAVLAALPPAVTQAQSPQQAVRALQTALSAAPRPQPANGRPAAGEPRLFCPRLRQLFSARRGVHRPAHRAGHRAGPQLVLRALSLALHFRQHRRLPRRR